MSEDYTHKMIVFSEEDFTGDALVLMNVSIPHVNNYEFDLSKFEYMPKGQTDIRSFSGRPKSLITDKGHWMLTNNSTYYLSSHPGDLSSNLSAKKECYPLKKILASWSFSDSTSGSLGAEKINYEEVKSQIYERDKPYEITFFPLKNAFIISPAPPFIKDNLKIDFRWIFLDKDAFVVNWDDEGAGVKTACLQFIPHKTSARNTPVVQVKRDGVWGAAEIEPNYPNQITIRKGDELQLNMVTDGAGWAFNFICTINKERKVVDPEGQMGDGTGKNS
ncbi:MAG TPA: hypothetical protein VLC79_11315 [Cellvibrio sp.]|nr:hypothetical protein [Cellvibrio sp.]